MEVGWYLRFAKTDRVEAQIALKAVDQVLHARHIHSDWCFDIKDYVDHALAVMTRIKPLFDKDDK